MLARDLLKLAATEEINRKYVASCPRSCGYVLMVYRDESNALVWHSHRVTQSNAYNCDYCWKPVDPVTPVELRRPDDPTQRMAKPVR